MPDGNPASDGAGDLPEGASEVSVACEGYVERFRAGGITYSAAVAGVSKSLADRGTDGAEFDAAFSPYLASLQEVSRDRGNAASRAPGLLHSRGRVGERSLGGRGSIGGQRSASPTRGGLRDAGDGPGGTQRTAEDPTFAWMWDKFGSELPGTRPTRPLSRRINSLLHMNGTPRPHPQHHRLQAKAELPSWALARHHWGYVDLDKLREDVHSHAMAKPDCYDLRDGVKVLLPGASNSAKTKTVVDFNTWDDAWERYSDAVTFAFPMREKELKNYRRWVRRQFHTVTAPGRVVGLDRAIRKEAGDGASIALDDFQLWNGLTTQYLSSFGVGEAFGASPSQRGKGGAPRPGGSRGDGTDVVCRAGTPETVDSPVVDINMCAVDAGPTTMRWNMNGKRVAPVVELGLSENALSF